MAVRFEAAGERLEIHQTRRGLRIVTWLFVVSGVLGMALTGWPRSIKVSISCSHATDTCTITHPHTKDWKQPVSSLTGIELTDNELRFERGSLAPYYLCTAPRADNAAAAAILGDFLRDPKIVTAATECTSHLSGIPIVGRIASVFGMVLLYLLLTAFLVDAHTIVDRAAGTIAMRGSKWPLNRWSFERPLSEVSGVSARKINTGRGQYMYLVDLVFDDGAVVRAMSPAAFKLPVLQQRIAELRRFVGLAPVERLEV